MGIGPTQPAWKAGILPLNYTRIHNAKRLYQNPAPVVNYFLCLYVPFFYIFYAACQTQNSFYRISTIVGTALEPLITK